MKKVSFDTKNGYLLLDGIMMAPLNESEFIKIAKENDIKTEDNKKILMCTIYQRAET